MALAVLAALVVVVVLLTRDSDDSAQPSATPTVTAEPSPTTTTPPSPTPTDAPSPSPSPTGSPSPSPQPGQYPDLMADAIGPLRLRMTAQEAVATGAVTLQDSAGLIELIPDPTTYPGLFVGYDPQADSIGSFTIKDDSPIRTPDGIGVDSDVEDLREAYGPLLQERTEDGQTWYLVAVDDVGYAFFPTEVELVMVSATDIVLSDVRPGTGL